MNNNQSSLVERLTAEEGVSCGGSYSYMRLRNPDGPEAAARIKALEDALTPFARGEVWAHLQDDEPLTKPSLHGIVLLASHCRKARSILEGKT